MNYAISPGSASDMPGALNFSAPARYRRAGGLLLAALSAYLISLFPPFGPIPEPAWAIFPLLLLCVLGVAGAVGQHVYRFHEHADVITEDFRFGFSVKQKTTPIHNYSGIRIEEAFVYMNGSSAGNAQIKVRKIYRVSLHRDDDDTRLHAFDNLSEAYQFVRELSRITGLPLDNRCGVESAQGDSESVLPDSIKVSENDPDTLFLPAQADTRWFLVPYLASGLTGSLAGYASLKILEIGTSAFFIAGAAFMFAVGLSIGLVHRVHASRNEQFMFKGGQLHYRGVSLIGRHRFTVSLSDIEQIRILPNRSRQHRVSATVGVDGSGLYLFTSSGVHLLARGHSDSALAYLAFKIADSMAK